MGNEVEARTQRVRDHLQRPDHSDWQLTNARIRSTVYLTAPDRIRQDRILRVTGLCRGQGACRRRGVPVWADESVPPQRDLRSHGVSGVQRRRRERGDRVPGSNAPSAESTLHCVVLTARLSVCPLKRRFELGFVMSRRRSARSRFTARPGCVNSSAGCSSSPKRKTELKGVPGWTWDCWPG
jgi:hypothetical protein